METLAKRMGGGWKRRLGAVVLAAVLPWFAGGCASFQPIPGPGRDGGLYRYTVDYEEEYLPFGLVGKGIIENGRGSGFSFNCCMMGLSLFPGMPLYAAEQYAICPLVDTLLIPYDLFLKWHEGRVCAHDGLRVNLIDAAGRPVAGCEISVIVDARAGYRIVYDGKPCPRGWYSAAVTTDENGEAYVPIDMGTCEAVRLEGKTRTSLGQEDFRAQVGRDSYWWPGGLARWDEIGEKNHVVMRLKGYIDAPEETSGATAAVTPAWQVAPFAGADDARTPPVPEDVRAVLKPVGKGRLKVVSGRGGAASLGIGMEPGRRETLVWNGAGKVVWRGNTKWMAPTTRLRPKGVWNGGDVAEPVRPQVGVLAWNGADVEVRPAGWKKGEAVEVFAWTLDGFGRELAQRAGEALGIGTNAVCFDAEPDGGRWIVRWDSWPDAPGSLRFYALAPKGDADGDGLSDGRETVVFHTDPRDCDSDGDNLSDFYEVAVGSNPGIGTPHLNPCLTIQAFWSDPDGAGNSWVMLFSTLPRELPLDGFRLETAKDGNWRTVAAFSGGDAIRPGGIFVIGEKNVADADFRADLDLPPHWPGEPVAGVRLVWDGAPCGNVVDAVIVGHGKFDGAGGGSLDRTGWDSPGGIPANGAAAFRHRTPGWDNDTFNAWDNSCPPEAARAAPVFGWRQGTAVHH